MTVQPEQRGSGLDGKPFLAIDPRAWEKRDVTELSCASLRPYYYIFIFIQGHPYRPIGLLTGCPNQVHN